MHALSQNAATTQALAHNKPMHRCTGQQYYHTHTAVIRSTFNIVLYIILLHLTGWTKFKQQSARQQMRGITFNISNKLSLTHPVLCSN